MLTPEQIQPASTAVRDLRVALSNFFLYSNDNNMVLQSLERFLQSLEALFLSLPSLSIGESEGRLVVEGSALNEKTTGSTNMIKDLFLTHKIHNVTFHRGIQTDEMKAFFGLLKPRGLTEGMSFFKALENNRLDHIEVNEKVFVAIREGEKVVQVGEEVDGEENMQEALEALQYFLQIFAKVRPESNKREVAKKMVDNMGGWLLQEGLYPTSDTPGKGGLSGGSPGSSGGAGGADWGEIIRSFGALRKNLAAVSEPGELKSLQFNMDDLLRRLVLLGESQGFKLGEETEETQVQAADDRLTLFEIDPVLSAVDAGDLSILTDRQKESEVDSRISRLQEEKESERFGKVWQSLWKSILSADASAQSVSLRHLNRLQWLKVPRPDQLEGFRNLRSYLTGQPASEAYPIGLTLLQNWLPEEIRHPEWEELFQTASVLKKLSDKKPPLFEGQDELAQATLDMIFGPTQLQELFSREPEKEEEKVAFAKLFLLLHTLSGPFLIQITQQAPVASQDWKKAVDLLNRMEITGVPVFEKWLQENQSTVKLERFLEIFKKASPPKSMPEYITSNWKTFEPETRRKILEMIQFWEKQEYRTLLIQLLDNPEDEFAIPAMRILGKLGLEGDSRTLIATAKKFPMESKARENFLMETCQVLGELQEPYAINELVEWADSYKFLEIKKERGMALRTAAVQALGHYRSHYVEKFLTKLSKEAEKELKPEVLLALKSVQEKLKVNVNQEGISGGPGL